VAVIDAEGHVETASGARRRSEGTVGDRQIG